MNLVVNARDAMPGGGRLTVEVGEVTLDEAYCASHLDAHVGAHVLLAVSDSGMGMPTDVAARVFEPFFTTKERGKGTGLGLSTVYAIVQQWGGHIGVYSEPGKGSAFKVYLPRLLKSLAPAENPCAGAVRPAGRETILLVEDEDGVRDIARETLLMHGYKVIEARDGVEALAVADRVQDGIDLVLTDVVMPRMSGRELAERLRQARPEVKVIFMSGYTDDVLVRTGALSPGMSFLQKPLRPDALAAKVREALDAPTRPFNPR